MQSGCPTLCSLLCLGFEIFPNQYNESTVAYHFKNVHLEASYVRNRFFQETVLLSGILNSRETDTMVLIETEIPCNLVTPNEAAAWASYALSFYEGDLGPLPDWMLVGKKNWDLIPFVREAREYDARPLCRLDREYAKILRQRLRDMLLAHISEQPVQFAFDGRILSVKVYKNVFDVPASGSAWEHFYEVVMGPETKLPSRFMSPVVSISFYKQNLIWEGRQYAGAKAIDDYVPH